VWASSYAGTRVFGTTLGHGNDTWTDPVFQDLLTRGIKWAVGRSGAVGEKATSGAGRADP
jgi:type 1 glutamine amidotransferase